MGRKIGTWRHAFDVKGFLALLASSPRRSCAAGRRWRKSSAPGHVASKAKRMREAVSGNAGAELGESQPDRGGSALHLQSRAAWPSAALVAASSGGVEDKADLVGD